MALTPSTMLELDTQAPDFALPEPATGAIVSRGDFAGKPLLVMFTCNHCPYVKHIADAFADFAREYQEHGLAVVAISANDPAHRVEDGPDFMAEEARARGNPFPYLYDETQAVAKAYRAACTPDFFLFDSDHRLVYRGQFDDSRPGNNLPVTGDDLRDAVKAMLAGLPVPDVQRPSIGCNIKWKPGNEPDYG
jgi:peroxiredoxin